MHKKRTKSNGRHQQSSYDTSLYIAPIRESQGTRPSVSVAVATTPPGSLDLFIMPAGPKEANPINESGSR